MSYREFADAEGRTWEVWEVHPTLTERRLQRDRRKMPRASAERRMVLMRRRTLPRALQEGWLAFQHELERRRFFPIPDDWEELSDDELAELVLQAQVNRRARRMV
jgi:hypothetical protein